MSELLHPLMNSHVCPPAPARDASLDMSVQHNQSLCQPHSFHLCVSGALLGQEEALDTVEGVRSHSEPSALDALVVALC